MNLNLRETARGIGQRIFDSFAGITGIYAFDHGHDCYEPGTVKLRVPSLCQTHTHCCGAIGAWAVYEAFAGSNAEDFGEFYNRCNPSPADGMTEADVASALQDYGIQSRTLRDVDFETNSKWIDRGRPLIVGVGKEEFEDGDHWVVVYGDGVGPKRVFLSNQLNPFNSREEVRWGEFKRHHWAPAGRALVCYRGRQELKTVRPS